MKLIKLSILILLFQFDLSAQDVFISMGNGVSNFSSNFNNRYSIAYNFSIKGGHNYFFNNFGICNSIGFYNLNSKIIENEKIINLNILRISSGLVYKLTPSFSLQTQLSIGKIIQKSIRISSPRYNYDFDFLDYSYSLEIVKALRIGNQNYFSVGVEFSKSIDGIIDNNFWQKDILRPYYFNLNIYYCKTSVKN